jgi:hypothetical protein
MVHIVLAAGETPLVQVAGGTLLAACIGFTLALMHQARRQYRDADESRDAAETRLNDALAMHRQETAVQMATDAARCEERITALMNRVGETERRERLCNRRVDLLIAACQRNGVEVPQEVWTLGTDS